MREKKRTWAAEQMQELERRKLVRRVPDPNGRRPEIIVLSDGEPFDDPGATASSGTGYVTISGAVIASKLLRHWGAPEVVGYLCAMTADRFARHSLKQRTGQTIDPGSATWFRQADWFNNKNPNFERPEGHTAYPFSTTTIQRGLRALRDQGLINASRTTRNPNTGQRFTSGPRMIYENRFAAIQQAEVVNLAAFRAAS